MRALLLSFAACAAILAYTLALPRPLTEPDEGAWIFSSYYYRLAFMERDFRSAAWTHADAVDHPPFAKFVIGASLARGGYVAHSLAAKERWFERVPQVFAHDDYLRELRATIPPGALSLARQASAAAVFAACLLTGLAGAWAFSAETGALAAFLLVLFPVTRLVAGMGVSDGIFTALLLACAVATMRWARRLQDTGRFSPGWSLLCGALVGALFDTKISGLAEAALLAAVPWLALSRARGPKDGSRVAAAALSAGTALAAAAGAAAALNPSLWTHPLAFASAMFEHRWSAVQEQGVVFFGEFHQTFRDQLCGFLANAFWAVDPPSVLTGAVTAFLTAAGLLAWAGGFSREEPVERTVLALHAGLWSLVCLATFKIAWVRYLLPMMPFLCLVAARGAAALAASGRSAVRRAAVAAAAAALLAAPARYYTRQRYWSAHPDLFARKLEAQKAYLAARFPAESASWTAVEGRQTTTRPIVSAGE